jgi:hypothetical protein
MQNASGAGVSARCGRAVHHCSPVVFSYVRNACSCHCTAQRMKAYFDSDETVDCRCTHRALLRQHLSWLGCFGCLQGCCVLLYCKILLCSLPIVFSVAVCLRAVTEYFDSFPVGFWLLSDATLIVWLFNACLFVRQWLVEVPPAAWGVWSTVFDAELQLSTTLQDGILMGASRACLAGEG